MCGNDFFDPIPSHFHDRIPIPIVVYTNIPISPRNNISIPILALGIRSVVLVMIT